MHWNKLPNIWSRYIQPEKTFRPSVLQKLRAFKRVTFDFEHAAKQCIINLHHKNISGDDEVLTCTVAEAIEKHLRPGKWIVPRAIPPEVYGALDRSVIETIDYRNAQPYSSILDYDLVDFQAQSQRWFEMDRKRGAQMFLLDCLPKFPHRDQSVISAAFKALSTGKVATFAITTRYSFQKPEPRYDFQEDDTLMLVDNASGSGLVTEELQGSAERNDSKNEKLHFRDHSVDQSRITDHHEERQNRDLNIASAISEQTARSQLPAQRQPEGDSSHARVTSQQKTIPNDGIAQLDLNYTELAAAPNQSQPENTLYQSGITSQTIKSSGATQNEEIEISPGAGNHTTGLETAHSATTIRGRGPFGIQVDDPSLTLCLQSQDLYKPFDGTYRVLAWVSKYMPHLWPNVMESCMPAGCKVDIQPRTDRGTIQYVIQPPLNLAVKSVLASFTTYEYSKLLGSHKSSRTRRGRSATQRGRSTTPKRRFSREKTRSSKTLAHLA